LDVVGIVGLGVYFTNKALLILWWLSLGRLVHLYNTLNKDTE
jgi:hypothetical protein